MKCILYRVEVRVTGRQGLEYEMFAAQVRAGGS